MQVQKLRVVTEVGNIQDSQLMLRDFVHYDIPAKSVWSSFRVRSKIATVEMAEAIRLSTANYATIRNIPVPIMKKQITKLCNC